MSDAEQIQEVESVADSIRAAMAEHEAVEEAPEAPPEEPTEEIAEEVSEAEDAPELPLKAREKPEGDEEPAEEASEEESEAEEEPDEVILAPASWSKEDREVFSKLDPDAQAIIARREAERDKVTIKAGEDLAPMKAVIDEYRDYFRQVGITPEASFRGLVAAEQSLRFGTPAQKQEALAHIARSYGIDMPAQQTGTNDQDAYVDPDVASLRAEFGEQLGQIKGLLTERQQAEQSARETEASATAARFFEDIEKADPAEVPEARYMEAVLPRFQTMVEAERGSETLDVARLKDIYRNAAWSIPEVRERLQEDAAARERTVEKKAAKRVVVRKESSSVSGGTAASAHSEEPPIDESVQETIARSMRQLERQRGAVQ